MKSKFVCIIVLCMIYNSTLSMQNIIRQGMKQAARRIWAEPDPMQPEESIIDVPEEIIPTEISPTPLYTIQPGDDEELKMLKDRLQRVQGLIKVDESKIRIAQEMDEGDDKVALLGELDNELISKYQRRVALERDIYLYNQRLLSRISQQEPAVAIQEDRDIIQIPQPLPITEPAQAEVQQQQSCPLPGRPARQIRKTLSVAEEIARVKEQYGKTIPAPVTIPKPLTVPARAALTPSSIELGGVEPHISHEETEKKLHSYLVQLNNKLKQLSFKLYE